MNVEEKFVPHALALKLSNLGFDELCLGYYSNSKDGVYIIKNKNRGDGYIFINEILYPNKATSAPLWQDAFDWFEDTYNLSVSFSRDNKFYSYHIFDFKFINYSASFDSRNQVREESLKKLIEIADNINNDENKKKLFLEAYKEGKIIQSNHYGEWDDFVPQNQLDKPNLDFGTINNWRIKL